MPTGVFDLTGRRSVVTGAGSGIGEAIARLFARRARVVVLDRDEAAAGGGGRRSAARAAQAARGRVRRVERAQVDRVFGGRRRGWAASTSWSTTPASRTWATSSRRREDDFDRVYRVNVEGRLPVRAGGGRAHARGRAAA